MKLFTATVLREPNNIETFTQILGSLPQLEQRKILFLTIQYMSDSFLGSIEFDDDTEDYPQIWAVAGALKAVVAGDNMRRTHLVDWLTSASGAGIGDGCGIRRAVIAALSDDKDSILAVLEKSMNQFADQLYMRHSPILQQEGMPVHRCPGSYNMLTAHQHMRKFSF